MTIGSRRVRREFSSLFPNMSRRSFSFFADHRKVRFLCRSRVKRCSRASLGLAATWQKFLGCVDLPLHKLLRLAIIPNELNYRLSYRHWILQIRVDPILNPEDVVRIQLFAGGPAIRQLLGDFFQFCRYLRRIFV
jgi:hypothetical protein